MADLQKEKPLSGDRLYSLACIGSLSAAAARRAGEAPLADGYAASAVALLNRAWKAKVFEDAEMAAHLNEDRDLDALREREDFKRFLHRVEEKPGG